MFGALQPVFRLGCRIVRAFHWVASLISVMYGTCFHLIIFTVGGWLLSRASGIDADEQAPTKIIFDTLFSRFNDQCRWNEAIERTGNKGLARNEGKLLG